MLARSQTKQRTKKVLLALSTRMLSFTLTSSMSMTEAKSYFSVMRRGILGCGLHQEDWPWKKEMEQGNKVYFLKNSSTS